MWQCTIHRPGFESSRRMSVAEPVGNLAPLPNGFVASNDKGIRVFLDVHAQFSVLTKRLEAAPEDLALKLDRARLCAAAGGKREDLAVEDLESLIARFDEDASVAPADRGMKSARDLTRMGRFCRS